ncbi:MAG TPA: hypothetical protein VLF59_04240 [Candidatus Saccharimonadales bacterium]|nr:hypothetical protein [Candidatus Saccharimonadales bacterium]
MAIASQPVRPVPVAPVFTLRVQEITSDRPAYPLYRITVSCTQQIIKGIYNGTQPVNNDEVIPEDKGVFNVTPLIHNRKDMYLRPQAVVFTAYWKPGFIKRWLIKRGVSVNLPVIVADQA